MSPKTGMIGLGQMGRGMALNLHRKTAGISVFDTSDKAMDQLAQAGATPVQSAADLAKTCAVIILCLPTDQEAEAALFGPNGVVAGQCSNSILIDTTTMDRNTTLKLADRAAKSGLTYCDCPVSGLPQRAEDGTLTAMFGGKKENFEHLKPLLLTFSKTVLHCGSIGSGQAMKAVNNIIYNINIAALCEVLPLAVAVGLDPQQLAQLVTSGSSSSFASGHFVPRMLARDFSGDFPMQKATKDIVNIQQMQAETSAIMPLVTAMIESYDAALNAGHGAEPKSAMLKPYETALNIQFKSTKRDTP